MKKILIFLLIAGYGFAADFLVLFDMPDNKKYVKHKNIPFYKEVKKELPHLKRWFRYPEVITIPIGSFMVLCRLIIGG